MTDSTIKKLKQIPYDKARVMIDKAEDANTETYIEHAILIRKEWASLSARLAKEFEENKLKFISNPIRATRYFYFCVKLPENLDYRSRQDRFATVIRLLHRDMNTQFGPTYLEWDQVNLQWKFRIYVTARTEEECKACSDEITKHHEAIALRKEKKTPGNECKQQ